MDGRRHACEAFASVLLIEFERAFDRACESFDVVGVAGQRIVEFLGGAGELAEHECAPLAASVLGDDEFLCDRFMPSRSGVTRQTSASR